MLGEPFFTLGDFDVEVYRMLGGEVKFFWASLFTAPTTVLTPWTGLEKDDLVGYVLIVYDKNIVNEIDFGSNQGDRLLEASGFSYDVGIQTLFHKEKFKEAEYKSKEVSSGCQVYVLPDSKPQGWHFTIDNKLIGRAANGYFKSLLEPGDHVVEVKYILDETYEVIYPEILAEKDAFEFSEDMFENLGHRFSCIPNEVVYFTISGSRKNKSIGVLKELSPPEEIYERRLIVHQEPTPWTITGGEG